MLFVKCPSNSFAFIQNYNLNIWFSGGARVLTQGAWEFFGGRHIYSRQWSGAREMGDWGTQPEHRPIRIKWSGKTSLDIIRRVIKTVSHYSINKKFFQWTQINWKNWLTRNQTWQPKYGNYTLVGVKAYSLDNFWRVNESLVWIKSIFLINTRTQINTNNWLIRTQIIC